MTFQSTRPVWGATAAARGVRAARRISIHAPRVGRDRRVFPRRYADRISIHAPRVGRDSKTIRRCRSRSDFNPRAPCGARPTARATSATQRRISIHAPRVGRDCAMRSMMRALRHFNPRAPCGARRRSPPRSSRFANFNPRAPCGARPDASIAPSAPFAFQSTRPVWGATIRFLRLALHMLISIHAPRVGRDTSPTVNPAAMSHFNPRAPCGARPCADDVLILVAHISIHAPRVGRDSVSAGARRFPRHFNPRAPCGARRRADARGHTSA